jgi:ubiquinone/menaquinone biosynthesis C-methylase UbiE
MTWASRVGKIRYAARMLERLGLRGDERLLDVGCGRGLLLVSAAKRLQTGRAIGIDIWSQRDQKHNRPEATLRNAALAGVRDRVQVGSADARQLPFEDGTFDLVVSNLALHNIHPRGERARAVREVARVVKPGGRVALADIGRTREYATVLASAGLVEISRTAPNFMFVVPTRTVIARRPA